MDAARVIQSILNNRTEWKRFIKPAVLALTGLAVFYVVKFAHPVWLEALFHNGQFDALNLLARSQGRLPYDFYLGRAQETFFGPLSQLISGLFFLYLALRYLKESRARVFGLSVFAYLLLTKFEILFAPPYGDAIGGPFAEAIWLARNNFNFIGLFQQPGYAVGGPKVYVFTIYPGFLALLMKLIPWTSLFLLINHLIVFALSTLIVVYLKEILQRFLPKDLAVCGALFLLYEPLFQAQTEAINMEIPCAFFIMLSAYFIIHKKINEAAAAAILATLIKGSGVVACAGFFLVGAALFFTGPDARVKKNILSWIIALSVLTLVTVGFKFLLKDQHVSVGMVNLGKGWPSLNHMYIFYFYMGSLVCLAGYALARKFFFKGLSLEGLYERTVMFVYGGMWFALFFNFFAVSPRYRVLAHPFVVFCVLSTAALIIRHKVALKALCVMCVALALFSSYGFFYGPLPGNYHVLLERSLEYRNDLKLNQKLVDTLQRDFSLFQVVSPFILAQTFAIPELGYVRKGLPVIIYGFNCLYGGIRNYEGLAQIDVRSSVFVAAQVDRADENFVYPIGPQDKIVREVVVGDKKAWLFMGGAGIERTYQVMQFLMRKKAEQRGAL